MKTEVFLLFVFMLNGLRVCNILIEIIQVLRNNSSIGLMLKTTKTTRSLSMSAIMSHCEVLGWTIASWVINIWCVASPSGLLPILFKLNPVLPK